jgi:hypothetical protein
MIDAYQDVARRLGLLSDTAPEKGDGPKLVK